MTRQNTPTSMHDSDEREVESEEKQHGEKIEVDEERLPSQAMATHEVIRQRVKRSSSATPWRYYGQQLPPVCRLAPRW